MRGASNRVLARSAPRTENERLLDAFDLRGILLAKLVEISLSPLPGAGTVGLRLWHPRSGDYVADDFASSERHEVAIVVHLHQAIVNRPVLPASENSNRSPCLISPIQQLANRSEQSILRDSSGELIPHDHHRIEGRVSFLRRCLGMLNQQLVDFVETIFAR